eukprot:gene15714-21826_t
MSGDFSFPVLGGDSSSAPAKKLPLTARSTVVHAGSGEAPKQVVASAAPRVPLPPTIPTPEHLAHEGLEKAASQLDYLKLDDPLTPATPDREISLNELALHRSSTDCWVAFKGKVYDITRYMNFHPGGADILLKSSGRDVTTLFAKYHSWVDGDFILSKNLVGHLRK